MRTALRWVAGILIGWVIFACGYVGGFLLTLPDGPEPTEEPRPHLLQPGEPGFLEHLAEGCPGDPSFSPCALQLPAVDFTETGFSFTDSNGFINTCLPAGDHLDHFECTVKGK